MQSMIFDFKAMTAQCATYPAQKCDLIFQTFEMQRRQRPGRRWQGPGPKRWGSRRRRPRGFSPRGRKVRGSEKGQQGRQQAWESTAAGNARREIGSFEGISHGLQCVGGEGGCYANWSQKEGVEEHWLSGTIF